jgi:tRNA intron endonuclease, N-terminal domain
MSKLMNTPPLTSSPSPASQSEDSKNNKVPNNYIIEMPDTVSEEHLQLSLVEGFFLAYGLGCLEIRNSETVRFDSMFKAKAGGCSHCRIQI